MNKYIFDSHVHSKNSFDATDSIDQLCQFAIEKGINGFCLTDHLDVNEYDEKMGEAIKKSYEDALYAQEKYKDKLIVRSGVELGQPLQNLQVAENIISRYNFDFIIGSMHNTRDKKDFYFMKRHDFEEKIDELLSKYYEEYYEMTKWGKFNVIGHITYPLRYVEGIYKMKVDMAKYNEIIYEMLKVAVHKGIGIEINVSGFRQDYKKQFPNFEHIKMYKDLGGEIITIGTDSHNRYSLGENFNEGKELILKVGLKHFCKFENRKAKMIKIL